MYKSYVQTEKPEIHKCYCELSQCYNAVRNKLNPLRRDQILERKDDGTGLRRNGQERKLKIGGMRPRRKRQV